MIQPDKIIVADDHPLFRQALLETLKTRMPSSAWFQAETVEQLNEALLAQPDADLLLLDLNIPGAHGFNALIYARNHYPQIPVVVVSAYEDVDTINKAMSHGAAGFIPKSTPTSTIFEAINQVLAGNIWTPGNYASQPQNSKSDIAQRIASLTQQQYKILMMFAEGLLNKQIAYEMNIQETTVKQHVSAILRKMEMYNRTQLSVLFKSMVEDLSLVD